VRNLINKIHESQFFGRIFHTVIYCLQKELEDCKSVLDLGCGPSSPLKYCHNIKYSVGVEAFGPYLEESKKKNIHTEYFENKIEDADFSENSFDAVILVEVLEHLPEHVGLEIIERSKKWAKKKVIITTPNGFIAQEELDGNPLQKHLSGWDLATMRKMEFKCRGLAGLKFLRREVPESLAEDDLTAAIRYRPRIFWFVVATISQLMTYYVPSLAFELFCVKKIYEPRN
jgi:SAM-dependent methyltransferase